AWGWRCLHRQCCHIVLFPAQAGRYSLKLSKEITPPEVEPLHLRYGQEQWEEGDLYDKEKQQKPQFKKKLTSVRMKCFGPAHFECRLTPIGDPTMVVEWLHDGKPLAAANRLRMVNEFGYCSLDYEVAYARDSGVITCRATNKFGVDQTSATLIVKDEKGLVEETQLPEGRKGAHRIDEMERLANEGGPYGVTAEEQTEKLKPEIVLLPEPLRVMEGDTARFRCRVTGYPPPKVNWYLNGQLIRKSKRYRLSYDGIYYLEITDVKSYDSGEVKVVADNNLGSAEHTVKLEIQQKEDFRSHLRRAAESFEVAEGGQCFFRYRVTGKPLPDIQWLKGGFHIQPNEFCVIINHSDGSGFINMKNAKLEHSGVYTCKAFNQNGEDCCTAELLVVTHRTCEEDVWLLCWSVSLQALNHLKLPGKRTRNP
uniref:Ig-like domain-containing protein n=1 Tax=Oryzias melastigma TaxID=30732 RepID=A0A3B3DK73_ORYME